MTTLTRKAADEEGVKGGGGWKGESVVHVKCRIARSGAPQARGRFEFLTVCIAGSNLCRACRLRWYIPPSRVFFGTSNKIYKSKNIPSRQKEI